MNINLATRYGWKCSPPLNAGVSFYNLHAEDFLFESGEQIEIFCQSAYRTIGGTWRLYRNGFTTPFASGELQGRLSNRFSVSIPTADLRPDFYDLKVELDIGRDEPERAVSTFGWQVENMVLADSRPDDFDDFWRAAKDEIDAVPLDSREETESVLFTRNELEAYNVARAALPRSYDPEHITQDQVVSQKVSFAGPAGGRVYGWLAKPEGAGVFPAILVLPGAGFAPRPRPLEHARHGYLALDIQVHGQDVCQDHYPSLDGGQRDSASARDHYYYQVHQRVFQAINYLLSRPDVDPDRIVVLGGSQGGRLTTVAAGVDNRVFAAVAGIAHFGNQPRFAWMTSCNEKSETGMDVPGPSFVDTEVNRCLAYYDPMNFAMNISCPVLMNAGLIDPVSKAGDLFGIYNSLKTADRTMLALPGVGHDWCAEFDRRAWDWLAERLGTPSAK